MAIVGNNSGFTQIISSIGGLPAIIQIDFDGSNRLNPSLQLPPAISGVLTTRTNDTLGILTAAGHGLAGTELLGFAWSGGSVQDCTITAHDANTVTFTVGSGDVLPAGPVGTTPGTALTMAVAQEITDLVMPGSNILGMQITSPQAGWCNLFDQSGGVKGTNRLGVAISQTAPFIYPQSVGAAVPFTQTVQYVDMYNFAPVASVMTVATILA